MVTVPLLCGQYTLIFLHSRSYMSFMALLPGREYSLDEFVPIGNFSILQPHALSLLSPELTTPQVQEAILKEPSRAIRALDDLKKGHSLEDYYLAHITTLHKMPSKDRITMDAKNLLEPSLSAKAFAFVKKEVKGGFSCGLILKGSHLHIQMSENFDTVEGLPFTTLSTVAVKKVRFCWDIHLFSAHIHSLG